MRRTALVAIGASVGALARWAMSSRTGDVSPIPWGTLTVNLTGCAAIGWCAARIGRDTLAWSFLVTGILGGLTTTSAFAAETRTLFADGRVAAGAGYVAASIGGGLAAAATTRRLAARADRR
jgi:CrcB protein